MRKDGSLMSGVELLKKSVFVCSLHSASIRGGDKGTGKPSMTIYFTNGRYYRIDVHLCHHIHASV